MSKVSIIIPVYNVEKYLERCLQSVIGQTFQEWEAICVNDGSPDNSKLILEKFSKIDNRIKVISQKNQGLSMARNNAMKLVNSEYVCCLDSDDALHPQTLEIIYNLAKKNMADLVSYKLESHGFDEKEWELFKNRHIDIQKLDIKVSEEPVFLGTHRGKYSLMLNSCTKLYKKSLLEGIEWIPKIHFEDVPHTYAVLSKKPKTVVINEVLYYFTVDGESIFNSSGTPKQIEDYHKGINYICDIYNKKELKLELDFLAKEFIPNILQQQLGRCRHASKEMRPSMYKVLAEELRDLNAKGLIIYKHNRILKYITYRYIMKKY